jgi:hypothetical protein
VIFVSHSELSLLLLCFVTCFSLVGKLLIGYLDKTQDDSDEDDDSPAYLPTSIKSTADGFAMPAPRSSQQK